MKKLILPFITIILLSSCASKFSLQKRRYTKGFYFASAKGNTTLAKETKVTSAKVKEVNLEVPNEEVVKSQQITTPIVPPAEIVLMAPKNPETNVFNKPKYNAPVSASAENKIIQPEKKFKNIDALLNDQQNNLLKRKGENGAKLVILVILCFFPFINLIPVYIHDGNKITLNFWITLLLCFTLLGGIIFSLLVVLDVIDLS